MKKLCELCDCVATVICESDEARLCWGCDSKVHGANFLVGKHWRVLLCHDCQAPTPWNGSGPRLVATVAFCQNCVEKNRRNGKTAQRRGRRRVGEEEGRGSSNGGSGGGSDSDDEKEHQVVPWLSLSSRS
ncbi:zinc finger protein CONSTANS-LIKE 13-like [Cucurbita maxima]|uniref:Zinc finger protein CONSTANS-LIKE 13-like n=1 Tax=Cucurbita maxima TaxID=3661 RepID=A0A6J1IM17_CUCMA|nr:zinc finger protein CONSTANS-LIKE 13-like [Cucurbita maxima]